MINVETAVANATEYLTKLYDTKDYREILLEEVELSPDNQQWQVTLGYSRPLPDFSNDLFRTLTLTPKYRREYKVFSVDANTGEVRSMKIRQI